MSEPGAEALLAGGRFHEALHLYRQAVQREPGAVAPRIGMARAAAGTGDRHAAIAWLSDACRVDPRDAAPLLLLADLLLDSKLYAQALPCYSRLYREFGNRDRGVLLHYGFCHEQAGDIDEAMALYRAALDADPHFLEAHVDLAGVLWRDGDFEGALAHAEQAVILAPEHPYAVRILGTALLNLNRLQEAEATLRRALELKPGFALAELDLAFTLLLAGRLDEGWRWYGQRWKDTDRIKRPGFFNPQLEWRGPREQPPSGLRIAVYAEQGLGDVLQFIRYVPLLQAQGATVFCVVQPELVALVEHSMPGVVCLTPERTLEADLHAALLELPLHFGTTLDSIPAAVPYLRAPAQRKEAWARKLAPWDGQLKVGICWSGFRGQVNNRNRAIALGEWRGLMDLPGVQCFSLQKSDAGPFTDRKPGPAQLVDFTADWSDFTDSAALIESLDLVITVDTAIAHLAGALGRPVWTLLAPNADWRWLLERADSPWYPTMRLLRRGFEESRAAQMERVVQGVQELLDARGGA